MKIIISAFAFAPNQGSEPGVGWRWAIEIAKKHQVIVITDVTRQSLVNSSGAQLPENLRVIYFRPNWLAGVSLNSTTAQMLYTLWQFGVLGLAKQLHRQESFDLAIHITYGVFRHPSFLGVLGIPFVFGPLGGGEDAPLALKRSIRGREKIKELLRSLVNKSALVDPFLWYSYAKSTLILVKTEDTRRALPWPFRKRAIVHPEIGIDVAEEVRPSSRLPGAPLRVLFAGRLLGWKGAHLAIRAVAISMERGLPIEFTLLGNGPFETELRKLAIRLGINEHICWMSHVPQQELFGLYRNMHCFLFPSLHDSSGNVVLEAQANGLPVVCLDLGGPATLVTSSSALVVKTGGKSEDEVVEALSAALMALGNDESRRIAMGVAAAVHVRKNMGWSNRVMGVFDYLRDLNNVH